MAIHRIMPWELWTLAQIAELPVEIRALPLDCSELVAAAYYQQPVPIEGGVVVVFIDHHNPVGINRSWIARAVTTLLNPKPCLWLELLGNVERGTEQGDVLRKPSPTAARTTALAGGEVPSWAMTACSRLDGPAAPVGVKGGYPRRAHADR